MTRPEITRFEPLRGQENPSRAVAWMEPENGGRRSRLQVTGYIHPADLCVGRPVEELPRILSIYSPAHHLAAARLLDRLFDVEPPDNAVNMRDALGQALTMVHHLRKLHVLAIDPDHPFPDHHKTARPGGRRAARTHQLTETVMRTLAMAQEAATILGGRSDHPLTCVAGGVSRFLKDGLYERLAEIADACLPLTRKIETDFREWAFAPDGPLQPASGESSAVDVAAMATVIDGEVRLLDGGGEIIDRFPPEATPEKIAVETAPWTRLSFAAPRNGSGGQPDGTTVLVGPAARLAETSEGSKTLKTSAVSACRAILTELVGTAEAMAETYIKERFLGPEIRIIPESMRTDAWAALEGPAGPILCGVTVDERGLVTSIQVVDPAMLNHALRCRLAEATVAEGFAANRPATEIKRRMEVRLIPF